MIASIFGMRCEWDETTRTARFVGPDDGLFRGVASCHRCGRRHEFVLHGNVLQFPFQNDAVAASHPRAAYCFPACPESRMASGS